ASSMTTSIYSADWDREWQNGEARQGVMVFIGLHLPEEEIRQQFALLTERVN
ncbi:GTP-binding protein, partial [Arsenophonus sp.]|uniref:GTP-binding protein n=1 Tax=Arsenophonus sp. TaxID=1872640 RepID=UPI00387905B3